MRIFRLIIASVLVLGLTVCFLFLLFPSEIRISKVLIVRASPERIRAEVQNLSGWGRWNQFIRELGPDTPVFFPAASGHPARLQNNGLRIEERVAEGDTLETRWTNARGRAFQGVFTFRKIENGATGIEWYFIFHVRWYPWEKMGSMFYERQMAPVMEESLIQLQHLVENNP
jgi:hypothetical protein